MLPSGRSIPTYRSTPAFIMIYELPPGQADLAGASLYAGEDLAPAARYTSDAGERAGPLRSGPATLPPISNTQHRTSVSARLIRLLEEQSGCDPIQRRYCR